jgi:hypothetical protein
MAGNELASWDDLNARRVHLINKEIAEGLSPSEKAELDDLQGQVERYLDARFPLPFHILDRLGELAAKDGIKIDIS